MTPSILSAALLIALLPRLAAAQAAHQHTTGHAPADQAEKSASADDTRATGKDRHQVHAPVQGTGMDHSQMDHSQMDHSQMDHSQMDHSQMDHSQMDHSQMDHSQMDHSQMDHSQMDHSQMDHSQMDHSQMDHSQMDHSQMDHSQMDHSQMDHSQMDHSQMDHSGDALPRTRIPVLTDADRAAAMAPAHMHAMRDNAINHYVLLDRLEAWDAAPGTGIRWEAQGWVGTDLDRLWVHSTGERVDGRLASADVELLYGRSVSRWWDVVAGLRHDTAPGPSQDWLALGLMGLAPYRFEVQATAYLGKAGQAEARLEAEYDMLLTNRLILQPAVEVSLQAKDDLRRGVGSGVSTAEAGLRLRYEFKRRFAPYVGIVHARSFGRTAELRETAGDDARETRWVAGVRLWF